MLGSCQLLLTAIVFVAAAVGCSSRSMQAVPSAETLDDSEESRRDKLQVGSISSVHQGEPITDHEALACGHAIVSAIVTGNAEDFCNAIDWGAFGELVVAGLPNDTPEAEMYCESTRKSARGGGVTLAGLLIAGIANGGSAEVLRARETNGGKCVVIRFLAGDDGLNYHEYCLARRAGKVYAVDWYDYLSASKSSEGIQQIGIATLPYNTRSNLK